jgi:hypothetical protein
MMQEMPVDHPSLVRPSLDKIDLPHLCSDIKKCKEAGIFSDADIEWWDQFLASFEQKYASIPDPAPAWPVEEISTFVKDHPHASESASVIPDVILKLHSTEKQPSREVWDINLIE